MSLDLTVIVITSYTPQRLVIIQAWLKPLQCHLRGGVRWSPAVSYPAQGKDITVPPHIHRWSPHATIGCWIAHRNALELAASCATAYVLIVEDDVTPVGDLGEEQTLLAELQQLLRTLTSDRYEQHHHTMAQVDLLYLSESIAQKDQARTTHRDGVACQGGIAPATWHLGLQAVLHRRHRVPFLLDWLKTPYYHVDLWLAWLANRQVIHAYELHCGLFMEHPSQHDTSLIQQGRDYNPAHPFVQHLTRTPVMRLFGHNVAAPLLMMSGAMLVNNGAYIMLCLQPGGGSMRSRSWRYGVWLLYCTNILLALLAWMLANPTRLALRGMLPSMLLCVATGTLMRIKDVYI